MDWINFQEGEGITFPKHQSTNGGRFDWHSCSLVVPWWSGPEPVGEATLPTLFKTRFLVLLGPRPVAKKHTSAHFGFEQNRSVKKGAGPEPFWKAPLPKRVVKSWFGLIGPRAGQQKHTSAHSGFEQNRSVKKGLRPGTLLESSLANSI